MKPGYLAKRIRQTCFNRIAQGIGFIVGGVGVGAFLGWYMAGQAVLIYRVGAAVLVLVCVFALVAGVYEIVDAVRCLLAPARHPLYKLLARYGDARAIADGIEQELATGQEKLRFPHAIVLRDWILNTSFLEIMPIYRRDIIWAYQRQTTTRINGVVPVGKDYEMMIHTRKGQEVAIAMPPDQVDTFLAWLQLVGHNETVFGFSDEQKVWWDQQKESFKKGVVD